MIFQIFIENDLNMRSYRFSFFSKRRNFSDRANKL